MFAHHKLRIAVLVMLNSERRKASIDMIYTLKTTPTGFIPAE